MREAEIEFPEVPPPDEEEEKEEILKKEKIKKEDEKPVKKGTLSSYRVAAIEPKLPLSAVNLFKSRPNSCFQL